MNGGVKVDGDGEGGDGEGGGGGGRGGSIGVGRGCDILRGGFGYGWEGIVVICFGAEDGGIDGVEERSGFRGQLGV